MTNILFPKRSSNGAGGTVGGVPQCGSLRSSMEVTEDPTEEVTARACLGWKWDPTSWLTHGRSLQT